MLSHSLDTCLLTQLDPRLYPRTSPFLQSSSLSSSHLFTQSQKSPLLASGANQCDHVCVMEQSFKSRLHRGQLCEFPAGMQLSPGSRPGAEPARAPGRGDAGFRLVHRSWMCTCCHQPPFLVLSPWLGGFLPAGKASPELPGVMRTAPCMGGGERRRAKLHMAQLLATQSRAP